MMKQSLKKDNIALVLTGGEQEAAIKEAIEDVGWVEYRIDEFLKKAGLILDGN